MKQRGRFRIQTVSRMTGVPAPTLRAWERRYGIPSPERTGSSYRLYSEGDVALINRLRALTEQGIAPSDAANMVRDADAPAEEVAPAPDPSPAAPAASGDPWQHAANRIVGAVRRFDPVELEQAVRRAMMLGSARRIFDRVFAPALRHVGDEWHAGRLSIAQEHLATEYLGSATRDLLRLLQPDQPSRQILMACVRGEQHLLPLYGSALHFAQWGYQVVVLGADTPPEAVAHACASLNPDVVGLSITQPRALGDAQGLFTAYGKACGPLPWLVGGTGAEAVAAAVQAAGGLVATKDTAAMRDTLDARIRASAG